MPFYWFDIAALVLLLVLAGFGWVRGLLKEFFSVAAWVGAYLAALLLYRPLARWLGAYIETPSLAELASFILVLIAGWALVRLIEYLINEKAGIKFPPAIDRPGGALFGIAKAAVVLAVLLIALDHWPSMKRDLLTRSWFMRWTWYLSHPSGPLGMDVRPPGELKKDIEELRGKIPGIGDIKAAVPSIPGAPSVPEAELPPASDKAAPSSAPSAPADKSEKTVPATHPAQPVSPRTPPAAKSGATPPVKKALPVVKPRKESGREDDEGQMNRFIQSLDK